MIWWGEFSKCFVVATMENVARHYGGFNADVEFLVGLRKLAPGKAAPGQSAVRCNHSRKFPSSLTTANNALFPVCCHVNRLLVFTYQKNPQIQLLSWLSRQLLIFSHARLFLIKHSSHPLNFQQKVCIFKDHSHQTVIAALSIRIRKYLRLALLSPINTIGLTDYLKHISRCVLGSFSSSIN